MVLLDIGIGVIVVILLVIVVIYNGLIVKRNRVKTAWAQIEVQLKRRYDLIPNLVETVKGYMKYEKNVLVTVTNARTAIMSGTVQERAAANNQITQALKSLFAVAENYPTLKASETFKDLQDQLEGTEDKIAFTRTSYNDYVLDYNNAIQVVPGNFFAGIFGFKPMDLFDVPAEERKPIKVDLTSDLDSAPTAGKKHTGKAQPK
jgi:LemA protein